MCDLSLPFSKREGSRVESETLGTILKRLFVDGKVLNTIRKPPISEVWEKKRLAKRYWLKVCVTTNC